MKAIKPVYTLTEWTGERVKTDGAIHIMFECYHPVERQEQFEATTVFMKANREPDDFTKIETECTQCGAVYDTLLEEWEAI